MFKFTDDVKIVSSFHKSTKKYGKVEMRATHGFILRVRGSCEYLFEDKSYWVREGELIFLPLGSKYEYRTDDDDTLYTSINFLATIENPHVAVYPIENFHSAGYIIQNFSEMLKFGEDSEKYKCLSLLYDLISYVSRLESLKSEEKKKQDIIEPAIEYLKKHIYESSLRIDKLHAMCGISDTYFRKIFKSRFNMTPQEYVLYERITHARGILESGDYDTIKEVALSVGYTDALYFGKAFRRFYGFSPSYL